MNDDFGTAYRTSLPAPAARPDRALALLVDKADGRMPPAFWDLWRTIDGQYAWRIAP